MQTDKRIGQKCESIMESKLGEVATILKQFDLLQGKNLESIIKGKADVTSLEELRRDKVSLSDWHGMINNLNILYNKLKLLSVVQTDLVAQLIPVKMKNLKSFIDNTE